MIFYRLYMYIEYVFFYAGKYAKKESFFLFFFKASWEAALSCYTFHALCFRGYALSLNNNSRALEH